MQLVIIVQNHLYSTEFLNIFDTGKKLVFNQLATCSLV